MPTLNPPQKKKTEALPQNQSRLKPRKKKKQQRKLNSILNSEQSVFAGAGAGGSGEAGVEGVGATSS